MQTLKVAPFKVIGISTRTSNGHGHAARDIGGLWGKLMSEGIIDKIPGKQDGEIYAVYTNYEGDYTKPYDVILGCRVVSLETIPEGMVGQAFEGGTYTSFVSKGDLTNGAVYNSWLNIWKMDLHRAYSADFEVYGAKAQNPADAEVDIFIALNG